MDYVWLQFSKKCNGDKNTIVFEKCVRLEQRSQSLLAIETSTFHTKLTLHNVF